MLKPGQVFNNRYKIISTLGEGGFGAVYKVWDDNLQRFCAIKENLQVSEDAQKQFRREAIMLANLNHPHLVRVTDYFFISDRGQYLVMDYVEGDNLETILTNNKGPLPSEQALAWIRQVCDALIYIHNQNPPIIHRDVKPANIRITPQGNAVVVDFGLAKAFDVGAKTSMGARGLTPHFAAPEQYGSGGTDAQSDIYSLGVTLYCMLTYRVPPDSVEIMVGNAKPPPPAKTISGNVPDSISDALQCAMQIRRTERYKSVSDFKNALSAEQKPFAQVKVVAPLAIQASNLTGNKLTLSNGMEFMCVPAGKFLMGSDNGFDHEKPQHTVELSEYFIGKYPVTNHKYQAFVRDAKYKPPENWVGDQFPANKGNHPVAYVTWNDASAFCKWLSEKTGEQYRLPTEAEWEKAARGTDGRVYPWGDDFDPKKANTNESEINGTTSVGQFSPQGDSPYGCADMAGNVFEWCNDWFSDTYYQSTSSSNPLGPNSGADRVLRGGSWNLIDYGARSAYRYKSIPTHSYLSIGFRCARSLPLLENLSPKPIQVITSPIIKIDKSDFQNNLTYDNKLTLSNGMEFMRVPAGKFLMGKEEHQHIAEHIVEISGYLIGKYPVTNREYQAFVRDAKYKPPGDWVGGQFPVQKENHPVVYVSWNDAIAFCKWLSEETGESYRLPTEAEWEKAARGADGRTYPWGNEFNKNRCNSSQGGKKNTTSVGLYSPYGDSPYGCADMEGNVEEWCNDWFSDTYYQSSPSSNPLGPNSGTERVARGGAWYLNYDYARKFYGSAYRNKYLPMYSIDGIGFRCARSLP